jgi:hypothetical protein
MWIETPITVAFGAVSLTGGGVVMLIAMENSVMMAI